MASALGRGGPETPLVTLHAEHAGGSHCWGPCGRHKVSQGQSRDSNPDLPGPRWDPSGKILRPGWLWTSLDGLSKDQLNQIPLPEAASSYQVRRRIEIQVTSRVPGFPRRLEPAAGTMGLSRGPARLRKTSAY